MKTVWVVSLTGFGGFIYWEMPQFALSFLFLRLAKPSSFLFSFFLFFFLTDYSFYTTDQPSHFSVDFLYLSQTAVAKTRPGRILFVIEGLGGELMILAFTPHYKWLLLQKYAIINSRSACGWLVLNPCPLRSSHSVIIQLIFLSA